MRQFTVKDNTYTISEEEYQKLLDRSDTSKAFLRNLEGRHYIEAPCICPDGSVGSCARCSLGPGIRCLQILRNVGFDLYSMRVNFTYDLISWPVEADDEIRPKLDWLRKELLKLPKLPEEAK